MDASVQNKELIGILLRSTIGVISRRTSDAYANVIIRNSITKLSKKFGFLRYVKIVGVRFNEVFDVVEINDEINKVNIRDIGKASIEFIQMITRTMGRSAGYYFIREIKEDLPYDYEKTIKDIGLDLDYLQLDFLTRIKSNLDLEISHSDIIKHIVTLLFDLLDSDFGRKFSYKILNETITRLSISQDVFKLVKINDINSIQNVELVNIEKEVNKQDSNRVGTALQKLIQEVINSLDDKSGFDFIEKIKNRINPDYNMKLRELGIDLSVIKLRQDLIVRQVLIALVDVLSDSSTQSYAVMLVNNALKSHELKFSYLAKIKIDGLKLSQGIEGIEISTDIDSVRASELGRGLQRVIEEISTSLGEEAGKYFVDKFKRRLGHAYLLRIEEMGVNLHMIELKRSLLF